MGLDDLAQGVHPDPLRERVGLGEKGGLEGGDLLTELPVHLGLRVDAVREVPLAEAGERQKDRGGEERALHAFREAFPGARAAVAQVEVRGGGAPSGLRERWGGAFLEDLVGGQVGRDGEGGGEVEEVRGVYRGGAAEQVQRTLDLLGEFRGGVPRG